MYRIIPACFAHGKMGPAPHSTHTASPSRITVTQARVYTNTTHTVNLKITPSPSHRIVPREGLYHERLYHERIVLRGIVPRRDCATRGIVPRRRPCYEGSYHAVVVSWRRVPSQRLGIARYKLHYVGCARHSPGGQNGKNTTPLEETLP